MNIILDILIIVTIFLFMLAGYKKGFIRSLFSFICSIVSLITSFFLAPIFSNWVYETFIRDAIISNITKVISESMGQNVNAKVESVISSIPFNINDILGTFGISESKIGILLGNSATNSAFAIERLFYPVVMNYVNVLVGLILFLLISISIKLMSRVVFKATQVPVIRQVDWLLGMLFGMFKGLIFVIVLLAALSIINRFDKSGVLNEYISEENVNSTFIFKHIYNQNPIYKFKEILNY